MNMEQQAQIAAANLTMADEVPLGLHELPDNWSESYCFDAYDAQRDIALWVHIGRWWRDPAIWREQVIVLLPDGRTLLSRQFGEPAIVSGVIGSSLRLTFVEAGQRIRLSHAGAARLIAQDARPDMPTVETTPHLLRFDLDWSASGPVWDFGRGDGHEIRGAGHSEQALKVTGTMAVDGMQLVFDGDGYRDHSRGPRDIRSFGGHVYLHGQFPDGRAFGLYDVAMREGDQVVPIEPPRAVVFEGDNIYPATIDRVPRLERFGDPAKPFAITFTSMLGQMRLEVFPRRRTQFTLSLPFDYWTGLLPSIGLAGVIEDFATFRWNGMEGAGLVERSRIFA